MGSTDIDKNIAFIGHNANSDIDTTSREIAGKLLMLFKLPMFFIRKRQ
jgi:hypothetical protein